MGIEAAVFETAGQRTEHLIPGVFSRSNNVSSPSGVSANNLVIMGTSTGGQPNRLLAFSSLGEAKDALVKGELLEAIGHAFNCSPDYSPQRIFALRVNPGTQSSLDLMNGDTKILSLKSWDYGVHTNQLKLKIEDGDLEKSKKITVTFKENEIVMDNIVRKSLSLTALDDEATYTVSKSSNTLRIEYVTKKEIPPAEEGGEPTTEDVSKVITINLTNDVDTLNELAERINNLTDESGNPILSAELLDTREGILAKEIDSFYNHSITSEGVTLFSTVRAIIDALENCQYIGSVSLESDRFIPESTSGYQYFSGAIEGTSGIGDFANSLEYLETENVQIIATPSTNPAVHSLIANHCKSMSSTVNKRERTAFVGGSLNENLDTALANAAGLNSRFISYVADSAKANNPLTGEVEEIPGAVIACKLAGMEASMSIPTPLTNKALSVLSFNAKRKRTDIEKMIAGGILPCNELEDGRLGIIRAMTTYQGNSLLDCERSCVREDLYMNRDLRSRFASSVGTSAIPSPSDVIDVLVNTAKEWASFGYIVPRDDGSNVFNAKVRIDGDKTYLEYDRYLVTPRNFVFITANNYTYSTASVVL